MELLETTTDALSPEQREELRGLLDRAFDGDFSDADWEHALGGHHALVVEAGRMVAHGSVVRRSIELGAVAFAAGYVEAVGTEAAHRRRGLGSTVMRALEVLAHRNDDDASRAPGGRHSARIGRPGPSPRPAARARAPPLPRD